MTVLGTGQFAPEPEEAEEDFSTVSTESEFSETPGATLRATVVLLLHSVGGENFFLPEDVAMAEGARIFVRRSADGLYVRLEKAKDE